MPGDRGEVEDSPGTGISSSLLQVRTKTPCVNCESRQVSEVTGTRHRSLIVHSQIFCNKGRPRCTQCEDNRLQCKYNDAVHVGGDQRADSQAPDHMRDRVRLACLPCRQRKVSRDGLEDSVCTNQLSRYAAVGRQTLVHLGLVIAAFGWTSIVPGPANESDLFVNPGKGPSRLLSTTLRLLDDKCHLLILDWLPLHRRSDSMRTNPERQTFAH